MMNSSRRDFMGAVGMTTCAAWLAPYQRAKAAGVVSVAVQPDILFIMPDQMRGDCLSILGHSGVRTPHLDQLALQGTLFTRAYTTCPSCIPARYALLTGQHPQTSGVVGFEHKRVEVPTLPQLLTDAGYSTFLVGRYMHQVPENNGYEKQILGSVNVSDDDYDKYLRNAAPESGGIKNLTDQLKISYNYASAKPWPLAEEMHPVDWTVRESRKVVAEAPQDKPLFLTTSFYSPHPPLFPPARYFDACRQRRQADPALGDWVDWDSLSPEEKVEGDRILFNKDLLRDVRCGYFGLIDQIDDQIGSLIDEFKARSQQANRPWVIIFSSDHGEMLGDHDYYRKCEPYEGSAHVPFIIAGSPELGFRAGLRSDSLVCLEDIMPTLLDLAGTQCPVPLDGVSLIPVLQGGDQNIRALLQIEHAPCYSEAQAFLALTDGRFKYIWRPLDGSEQLFDLEKDPQENHDLSQDVGVDSRLKEWRDRMIQRLAGRPEGFSDGQKLIAGRLYLPIQNDTIKPASGL